MHYYNISRNMLLHRNLLHRYVTSLHFKIEHPIPDFRNNVWLKEAPKPEVSDTLNLWILDLRKSLPISNRRELTLIRLFQMNMSLAVGLTAIYWFNALQYPYLPLMAMSNAAITVYILLHIFDRPYALSQDEVLHGIEILQEQLDLLEKRE